MRRIATTGLGLTLLLGSGSCRQADSWSPSASEPATHPVVASPFDEVRWRDGQPEVYVGRVWARPISIDGLAVDEILAVCEREWPDMVEKRFEEDLMEAMALLGPPPGFEVELVLRPLDGGADVLLEGIPNTAARRQALWRARHQATLLTHTISWEAAQRDVQLFEQGLRERFSYLEWRGVDLDAAIEAELSRAFPQPGPTILVNDLARALHRVLMQFGDGHAHIEGGGFDMGNHGPFLPFLLSESAQGVVAYLPDRSGFLDPDFPLLLALDGQPIATHLAQVRPLVCSGSPQRIRRHALRSLRDTHTWRPALDPDADPQRPLEVVLGTLDGREQRTRVVTPQSLEPLYGSWPGTTSQPIEGDLGYLRLSLMDEEALEAIYTWMPRFRDTRGLIVDVRGNGGGSRLPLLALAGFLIGPDQEAWVGNFAAYRLSGDFAADHLEARYMWPVHSPEWSPSQRSTIDQALVGFTPEWPLPEGFSPWHALVLDRRGHRSEYAYSQPVVILSDTGSFSATDIFLGALERHPRVTLIGSASGGGSGRSQDFELPESNIEVRHATMASFRPSGSLYEGRGIEVDLEVLPSPSFFLVDGDDPALAAAIRYLSPEPAGG